jgi:heterodisulfide reductase subunit A
MFNKEKFEYQNIVMIQCVGSRQPSRSFCSFNCCEQAVKNALKIKEKNPRAEIYVLHRDIRVYDFAEENYEQAIEMGVKFIRMENYPVVKSEMVKLKLEVVERDSQTKIKLNPDLLVLSSGLVPHQANKKLAEILNVAISEDGFFQPPDPILHPLELSQPGIFATGLALSPQRFESVMRQAVAVAGKIGLMFL